MEAVQAADGSSGAFCALARTGGFGWHCGAENGGSCRVGKCAVARSSHGAGDCGGIFPLLALYFASDPLWLCLGVPDGGGDIRGIYEAVVCYAERGARSGADSQRQDESVGGTESGRRIAGERSDLRGNLRGWRKTDSRQWRLAVGWTVSAAVILLLAYKGFALTREIAGSYVNDHWLVQKDYDNYETRSYEIAGVTFYCPMEGDQAGYDSFPSSSSEADIVFLGEEIADGFRRHSSERKTGSNNLA